MKLLKHKSNCSFLVLKQHNLKYTFFQSEGRYRNLEKSNPQMNHPTAFELDSFFVSCKQSSETLKPKRAERIHNSGLPNLVKTNILLDTVMTFCFRQENSSTFIL